MMVRRRPIARAAVVGRDRVRGRQGRRELGQPRGRRAGPAGCRSRSAPAAPAPAAPAGGMSEEAIQQLKELAGLHDSGVLTDEEFEAQKAKLLA